VSAGAGPETCPDCFGEGVALGRGTKLEWRLRAIERTHERSSERETASEVLWLVGELRHTRDALTKILARCQDAGDSPLAREVQHEANRGLGLYEVESVKGSD
jgi:hypothetical protein